MQSSFVRSVLSVTAFCALAACGPSTPSNGPQKSGTVTISALGGMVAGMSFAQTQVFAGFAEVAAGVTPTCTTRTVGSCEVTQCAAADSDAGAAPQDAGTTNTNRSAGVITVSGGGQMVQLMPGADNSYASNSTMSDVFPAGTALTVSAAGDATGVPAFTASLTMPSAITLTMPTLAPATAASIPRTSPLAIAWTGGTTGKVRVLLTSSNSSGVICTFDAAGGTGTVPVDALSALPMGEGNILVAASDVREQSAGGFNLSISTSRVNIIGGAGRANFQ